MMRWLLLDEVLAIEKGKKAVTKSRVPEFNTDYGQEALVMEMMAQTGGLLLGAETRYEQDVIFAKIEDAEFSNAFEAGRSLRIEARSQDEIKPEAAWIEGSVWQGTELLAKARFLLVNAGRLLPDSPSSITFHREFMDYFKVKEKVK